MWTFYSHSYPRLTTSFFLSLQVKRINHELEVSVDQSLVLNTTLQTSGDLTAHVLFLGGVPENSPTRVKRQLGVSNFTTSVTRPHFKGTLQDIRVRRTEYVCACVCVCMCVCQDIKVRRAVCVCVKIACKGGLCVCAASGYKDRML